MVNINNTAVNSSDNTVVANPGMPDMSRLSNKEREVLVEYVQDHHIGLVPHRHDDVDIARSSGEKLFDVLTYKGIAWLGNAALSIGGAYTFKEGVGKSYHHRAAEALTPLYKDVMKVSDRVATDTVKAILMHAGLTMGGTSLLYPIKKLEDHKPEIVDFLDHRINQLRVTFGDGPTDEQIAVQDQTKRRLASMPKQNWNSIITGRAIGFASVFAASGLVFRGIDTQVSERISKGALEMLEQSSSKTLQEISKSPKAYTLGTIAAMDIGYSFLYEEVLYLSTRLYQKIKVAKLKAEEGLDSEVSNALAFSEPTGSVKDTKITNIETARAKEQISNRGGWKDNLVSTKSKFVEAMAADANAPLALGMGA